MRRLLTGIDADGRSCVLEQIEIVPHPVEQVPGMRVSVVHQVDESPPPPRPPALAERVEVLLPPGHLRWQLVEHPPGGARGEDVVSKTMHYKDTLDLIYIQAGSTDLLLQDGAHPVEAGDCIVMPGIDHAWNIGSDGCQMLVITVGSTPPAVP